MYIKLNNNNIEKYPYTIGQLLLDNPLVSFPAEISENLLEEFGVFPVKLTTPIESPNIQQKVVEDNPIFLDGQWAQSWKLVDMDHEEFEQKLAIRRGEVRRIRNNLLSQSDWTQLKDTNADEIVWAAYRQSLRDIPQQEGFPWVVTWPTLPQ